MIKKKNISKEDIDIWENYLKDPKDLFDKDNPQQQKTSIKGRFKFDLHGFPLQEANSRVRKIILSCFQNHYQEILLITGKGIHSNTDSDIYASKDLSKLRFSVPDFINTDKELSDCVSSISVAKKADGGEGAILIKLKKL